jgi:regulator of PEP synthase PpsR (kinase-PPPase family)
MSKPPQIVYFVSESTGITAETVGMTMLSQFPEVTFETRLAPFIKSVERANDLVKQFKDIIANGGSVPLVFATMPIAEVNSILSAAPCHYHELFNDHMHAVAGNLGMPPSGKLGVSHGLGNRNGYDRRMDVLNYALSHDDAIKLNDLDEADVILVGVSRSGKTPTCLYLALHFGIRAANYPLTDTDFDKGDIPDVLKENKEKLVGLTISAQRLAEIREKRRSGSPYAQLAQCQAELRQAMKIFQRYQLPVLDTTSSSIEELAARIVRFSGSRSVLK